MNFRRGGETGIKILHSENLTSRIKNFFRIQIVEEIYVLSFSDY